jgi:hypothetical protein
MKSALDRPPVHKIFKKAARSLSLSNPFKISFNIQNLMTQSLEILGNLLLDAFLLLLLPAVGHGGKVGPGLPNVADENSRLGGPEKSLSIILINYNYNIIIIIIIAALFLSIF